MRNDESPVESHEELWSTQKTGADAKGFLIVLPVRHVNFAFKGRKPVTKTTYEA